MVGESNMPFSMKSREFLVHELSEGQTATFGGVTSQMKSERE